MSSNRRIQSSRANGAKSRGPVTPEGKRKSASNSVRHGLLSSMIVLDDEKTELFAEILGALTHEFSPQTEAERIIVENMAIARWRQMRLWAIERASLQAEIDKHDSGVIPPATRAALAFRALADQCRALDLLNRYEARFDRQFARSLNLLMKLTDPDNPLNRFRQTNLIPQSNTPTGVTDGVTTGIDTPACAGPEDANQTVSESAAQPPELTDESGRDSGYEADQITSASAGSGFYSWSYRKALTAVFLCIFTCLARPFTDSFVTVENSATTFSILKIAIRGARSRTAISRGTGTLRGIQVVGERRRSARTSPGANGFSSGMDGAG